jgi:hypothetical protein
MSANVTSHVTVALMCRTQNEGYVSIINTFEDGVVKAAIKRHQVDLRMEVKGNKNEKEKRGIRERERERKEGKDRCRCPIVGQSMAWEIDKSIKSYPWESFSLINKTDCMASCLQKKYKKAHTPPALSSLSPRRKGRLGGCYENPPTHYPVVGGGFYFRESAERVSNPGPVVE